MSAFLSFDGLVVIVYTVAIWNLFNHSTDCHKNKEWRYSLALLGVVLLCFMTARFLGIYGIGMRWLYNAGHIALAGYGIVYWRMTVNVIKGLYHPSLKGEDLVNKGGKDVRSSR